MRAAYLLICALFLSSLARAAQGDRPARRTADELVLVVNENSPVSRSVGSDYAQKRHVQNILSIRCVDSATATANETVSMPAYVESIETPVRRFLADHPAVQFVVLTKGIPIRVTGGPTGERDEHSAPDTPLNSSVDSRLAAIGYATDSRAVKIKITGSGATGVGWANKYWNANEPFSRAKFGGCLVTRLDGYTEADAKALVSRALAAERPVAGGKFLFDVQPRFGLGDKAHQPAPIDGDEIRRESPWSDFNADMIKAHDLLARRGVPDELDLAETFVGHRSKLMGYFSWGSNDARFSAAAYESLAFAPGSICDTAVSTSGRTFLPTRGGQSLLADLIAHGLTCGKAYIDEPLLQAIASPSITIDRYTAGYTMAESLSAASHFTGWQDVVIGDPLCCPYFPAAKHD